MAQGCATNAAMLLANTTRSPVAISNSTAFDAFYRAHHADAVRWAVALVGDRGVAEELAQDALAAVGRRLGTVDDPPAYLRRTLANRAASWHRWHARERRRMRRAAAGAATAYIAADDER